MTTLQVENYSGLSLAIFKAIGGKNAKTLSGMNASIFEKVDNAMKNFDKNNLTFSKIYSSLYDLLPEIIKNGAYSAICLIKNITTAIIDFFKKENPVKSRATRDNIVKSCEDYLHKVNDRKTGNILFSNGRDENWCADTATFIYKDVLGEKLPKDFGSSAVQGMLDWGKKHSCYSETSTMSKQKRAQWILSNVKPGDTMVQKRNKISHVGIVTEVYEKDGVVYFKTIEGNYGKKLQEVTRNSNDYGLSGFISMAKWLD